VLRQFITEIVLIKITLVKFLQCALFSDTCPNIFQDCCDEASNEMKHFLMILNNMNKQRESANRRDFSEIINSDYPLFHFCQNVELGYCSLCNLML